MRKKRILVDMSATIIHHGHINILEKASKLGDVIIALTTDKEISKKKNYFPELNYNSRKKILSSIKFVKEIIPSKWLITNSFLEKYNIDYLVHGNDNQNDVDKSKLIIFSRTKKISTTILRRKIKRNF